MSKAKEKEPARKDVEAAQHVLDVACNSDFFSEWVAKKNARGTHADLRKAALDLLQDQFPDVDVRVRAYPNSEWVDLEVVPKREAGAAQVRLGG
jgi:2-polyprenyl-3-methyl-5-hydroxy-6-metoxy-1,4-benzoquinol methylase